MQAGSGQRLGRDLFAEDRRPLAQLLTAVRISAIAQGPLQPSARGESDAGSVRVARFSAVSGIGRNLSPT